MSLAVDTVCTIGAGPWEDMHIWLADGKKPSHTPRRYIVHYEDKTIVVTTADLWRVVQELFAGEGEPNG